MKNVRQAIGNTDHLSFIARRRAWFQSDQDYVDYDVREHHTNADTAERIKEDGSQAERRGPGVVRLSRGDARRPRAITVSGPDDLRSLARRGWRRRPRRPPAAETR